MSKKIYVTKAALGRMIKRLVKENADPAFITEPPVADAPIESDPRSEHQVEQGMLPVEDPEWEPSTQEELSGAIAQYISRTPDKELGDVWKDLKSVVDDAEERGEDDLEGEIQEAKRVFSRRHSPLVGGFVERLLREATDDDWDMGMQGWDPGADEYEDTPFDPHGSNVDLRDSEEDIEASASTEADEEAAEKAAAKADRDAKKAAHAKTVRKIGSFWRGGKKVGATVDDMLADQGLDPSAIAKDDPRRRQAYSGITNTSIRARAKLDFMNSIDAGRMQDLQDEATDQWMDVFRDHVSGEDLAKVAEDPRLIQDNETWLNMFDNVVVNAMAGDLNAAGFVGGEREAADTLGFRGWKGMAQKADTQKNKYVRQTRGDAPATSKKKKPAANKAQAAASKGKSIKGTTEWTEPKLRALLGHAEKTGNNDVIKWATAKLGQLGAEV